MDCVLLKVLNKTFHHVKKRKKRGGREEYGVVVFVLPQA
jgi:hypothetical protein